jgi:hypothetical protein
VALLCSCVLLLLAEAGAPLPPLKSLEKKLMLLVLLELRMQRFGSFLLQAKDKVFSCRPLAKWAAWPLAGVLALAKRS